MTEWWTYRPSDFLMFAPRTYWRLFELQNEAMWPAHVPAGLLALALLAGLWRWPRRTLRYGMAGAALAWLVVAYTFIWQRYAAVNWAMGAFAWAFALQALGLLVLSSRNPVRPAWQPLRRRAGLGLVAWACLLHPLLALASGRPWTQAEWIGFAPDPTAIATLGLLLCAETSTRGARAMLGLLRAGALAWLVVSSATLATMGSMLAAVPAAALLAAGVALWLSPSQPRAPGPP